MTRKIFSVPLLAAMVTAASTAALAQDKPIAVFKVPVEAVDLHPRVTGVLVQCMLQDAKNRTQFSGQKRILAGDDRAVKGTIDVPVRANDRGDLDAVTKYTCVLGVYRGESGKPVVPGGKDAPRWARTSNMSDRVVTVGGPYNP